MSSSHIHTQQVGRAFSGASETYDAHAVLQREIADRLLAHLDFIKIEPQRILDIGCGTGYFTRLLRGRYKRAALVAFDLSESMLQYTRSAHARRMPWHGRHHHAAGDAAQLPFKSGSFDLVCSNLAMQWVNDPQQMLAEMRRVLAPGGLMLFSTFGRRTLSELRQTLASIETERAGHVLPFPDVMSLGDALMKLPVELPVTDSDLFTLTYPDVMALVRELKGLGASASAIRGRRAGLYGRSLIRELEQRYPERYQMEDGRLSATFEALYGQAWYKEAGFEHGDHVIPIQLAGR
ncbi:malonyl-ACP O-methyltransferase BioC [Mariprofundus ferrooxydans]|jgi:malonyl-CoA O-methyltransferase|uniref:Malonyl-[acyl-carrier protein] O-methyltransferase n=1 Tax=Mariprofundus ferrooxydans PV-1 TaxID=314345 RepID=Q0EVT0_9PROT|nr:malonyl-ACP O-methyltransferase BioC [Mariprofundus ferrooxydans]EAU53386.1 Biotin biosynthesis protein BioC [Mariprofundus ferrooxydans PV-1]KON47566.1 biotin biosynthesis protein BioC [Mariprofundus ferrooxydans]